MSGLHTPGPWRITSNADRWDGVTPIAVEADNGEIIACNTAYYPKELDPDNAPIIAASPELLTALEDLLRRYLALVESGDAGFWDAEAEDEVIAARAAIAKATSLRPVGDA